MKLRFLICFVFIIKSFAALSQNKIDLKASFDVANKQIKITQDITYYNTSNDTLKTIYLNNWSNSFSTKDTPLAERIADEFKNHFHLAKNEDRGFSIVSAIKQNNETVIFKPLKHQIDVLEVQLNTAIQPKQSYSIHLEYIVQAPNSKFTKYGITESGDFDLRYWYITPAVYDGAWHYFSNKDLDDMFIPKSDITLTIECPNEYTVTSELDRIESLPIKDHKIVTFHGTDRRNTKLFLTKTASFTTIQSNKLKVVSDIKDANIAPEENQIITNKVTRFLHENLGDYPHKKLLITHIDSDKNPIYGLHFLPKFLNPYPKHFQYELKLIKIVLNNYLENTLLINPRKDQWLIDGIEIFYLIKYVEVYYPNMKFLGSLANTWGIKSFHASDMLFNEKYTLGFMLMARTNRDQPLSMAKDSLLKFNYNIANKYKAGIGFNYLDDFLSHDIIDASLKEFLSTNTLKAVTTQDFENFLKSKTNKNIDWFFTDYLNTREKIDFKIKHVTKTKDSITLTIKNKRNNSMPISLYRLKNDSVISKTWLENIKTSKTITIPRDSTTKLVLNYNKAIPEFNLRDNWKSTRGFLFNNKPLQFRLFQDIEDPNYNQVFFMPVAEFNNIYDGLTLGVKAYNKTVLRKPFRYKIEPNYAFKSKSLTGSVRISMFHYLENKNLYAINYGISASYSSYAQNLFVRKITPYLGFSFRNDNDFRSNKMQYIQLKYIDINRDKDVNNILTTNQPNYGVANIRYTNTNNNLINFNKWYTDLQIAQNFSKLSFNYEYRRLFKSNRQLNFRFFTGAFLKNSTPLNSDYFSFSLDRPTDYLFAYSYFGRSESTGLFSQQYIAAEGGFKSKLKTPYSNQWISTVNTSTTLWKYILAYGDVGIIKNKFNNAHVVYDSGIRINLVTDYFELYFPIYSNLGWEIGQPNYDERIRFKFTLSPQSLLGLFRRRWF